MLFKVIARRLGDSVEFDMEAPDIKGALPKAKKEAATIFDWKEGEPGGAPSVTVKPIVEKD